MNITTLPPLRGVCDAVPSPAQNPLMTHSYLLPAFAHRGSVDNCHSTVSAPPIRNPSGWSAWGEDVARVKQKGNGKSGNLQRHCRVRGLGTNFVRPKISLGFFARGEHCLAADLINLEINCICTLPARPGARGNARHCCIYAALDALRQEKGWPNRRARPINCIFNVEGNANR